MKSLCRLLTCFVALAFAGASSWSAEIEQRPNIVAIVTDDQGRWANGVYGNEDVKTPNMDRIAREGALFTRAFVATPVCSPSRGTYFTGRYPTELGITDYISPPEAEAGLGMKGLTWPQVLNRNGYRTALIGKWHLGTKPQFHPTRLGFDHFTGFVSGGTRPMDAALEINGKNKQTKGPLPDVLTNDAIRFIQENRKGPFCLCLHFRAPHLPYGPVPKEDSEQYEDVDPKVPTLKGLDVQSLKQSTKAYYASISSVDRNIGRLLHALDDLQLANTLVLFTSDHGYNEGRHYIKTKGNGYWLAGGVNGPKRPNMWDTSVLVPLAVRWPGVTRPGTKIGYMVSNLDMFRTMLGAAGLPKPEGEDWPARGIDYSPLLRGKSLPPREAIFGQYDLHNRGLAYMRMIRTKRFKYVKHFKVNFMDEFYDLEQDPGETQNLIRRRGNQAHASALKELQTKLAEWQQEIEDPVLKASY